MQTAQYKAGDTILTQDEDGSSAFLITSGEVEVVIGKGDKARAVATLKAGDVFGEMSLIEPGPRSATVRAVADTECAVTTYEDFMFLIRSNPDQAMAFMRTLVVRLRHMNEMMAAMDPQKRTLMAACRDWLGELDLTGENMTEEERERRILAMTYAAPYY